MSLGNSPKLQGDYNGDPKIVSIDLDSLATVSVGSKTATVAGVTYTATGTASTVVVTPVAAFVSSGLLLLNAYASAANQITVVVYNPTGAPIDLGATNFIVNVLN